MEETKNRRLRIAARAALAAHMLQIIVGLYQVDLDRIFLRRIGVELPILPLIIAVVEIGALLAVDVLLFCGKKSGGRKWLIWWTLCVILSLAWASYPIPQGELITYQADKVVFRLLPVTWLTPQFSLQLIWYRILPLLGQAVGVWLLQYGGVVFCAVQLLLGWRLVLEERKDCQKQ